MNNQLENKLSSREVCEMMEMEHSKLLRKIDGINEDLVKAKIGFYKYWQESTYINEVNNKPCREFQITKRGCEFLAHKTTGTKGNLFTDRYMDRFEQMKEELKSPIDNSLTVINKVFALLEGTHIMGAIVQTIVNISLQSTHNMLDALNQETKKIIINALEKKNNDLANEGSRIASEYNDNQAAIEMLTKDFVRSEVQ